MHVCACALVIAFCLRRSYAFHGKTNFDRGRSKLPLQTIIIGYTINAHTVITVCSIAIAIAIAS